MLGIGGGQFGTYNPISRQEAMTVLYRFLQYYEIELPGEAQKNFTDAHLIYDWAYAAMMEAVRTGLIQGHGSGQIGPRENMTRAQAVVIFLRLVDAFAAMPEVEPEPDPEEPEEPEAA